MVSALVFLVACSAVAQEAEPPKAPEAIPDPQAFVTRHTGTFNGVTVDYTARAGETYLPTMAATAAYHGKVEPPNGDFEAFLDLAREFSADELAPALIKGSALDERERVRIRHRLAWFTGLDPAYIKRADLLVTGTRFRKELLRDRGLSAADAEHLYEAYRRAIAEVGRGYAAVSIFEGFVPGTTEVQEIISRMIRMANDKGCCSAARVSQKSGSR